LLHLFIDPSLKMLNRRCFISMSLLSGAYAILPSGTFTYGNALGTGQVPGTEEGYLMTVTGKMKPADAGIFLPHEHTFTDFIGAEKVAQPQYDRKKAFEFILPYLEKLKASGVSTLAECTPAYIGRDAVLLKRLSRASGLRIITNTGYYAAVDFKYLPAHAHTESIEQLAARWLKEWRYGIERTGIRPGFIKLGVGNAPLKTLEKKLISAAAITHLKSGLKIAIHTGNGEAAAEEIELLAASGAGPGAMIWVHAQNDDNGRYHTALARKGCWISLDGFNGSEKAIAKYTGYLKAFKAAGLLNKVLISQDEGFAVVENGSRFELFNKENTSPYTSVLSKLKPALKKEGFSDEELQLIMVSNPADAFKIELKPLSK
jgi:predicted metal-dependent phosphotriesterase family hydrolase